MIKRWVLTFCLLNNFWPGPLAFGESLRPLRVITETGPLFINQARSRLAFELNAVYNPDLVKEHAWLIQACESLLYKNIPFEFVPSSDPRLKLSPDEPVRTAVTGTYPLSPIVFNMGIVNDYSRFQYEEAVSLLLHELGHKTDPDLKKAIRPYQTVVDEFANLTAAVVTGRDQRRSFQLNGQPANLILHSSFDENSVYHSDGPEDRYDGQRWPLVLLEFNGRLYDLGSELYKNFEAVNQDPNRPDIFTGLVINNIQIQPSASGAALVFKMSHMRNRKDHLGRHLNRYMNESTLILDLAEGAPAVRLSGAEELDEIYPSDYSVSIKGKLDPYLLRSRRVRMDLLVTPKADLRGFSLLSAKAVFEVNGKRVTIPLEEGPEWNKPRVSFGPLDPGATLKFLGLNISYRNPEASNSHMPFDWNFAPAEDLVEVDFTAYQPWVKSVGISGGAGIKWDSGSVSGSNKRIHLKLSAPVDFETVQLRFGLQTNLQEQKTSHPDLEFSVKRDDPRVSLTPDGEGWLLSLPFDFLNKQYPLEDFLEGRRPPFHWEIGLKEIRFGGRAVHASAGTDIFESGPVFNVIPYEVSAYR